MNNTCKECNLKGILGNPNSTQKYCKLHKSDEMIDITHKFCEFDNCFSRALFGFEYDKVQYCNKHKQENMLNIYGRRCSFIGCIKYPSFGTFGSKEYYCYDHKTNDMEINFNKKCIHPLCKKFPIFNYKNMLPQYCLTHKLDNMIDVVHKLCEVENCNFRATFDFKNMSGKYSKIHKLDGMISIVNRLCDICSIRAKYGKPGKKVTKCYTHREPGMITQPTKKCLECKNIAIYGKNNKLYHCETHKTEDEQNYVDSKCISCGLQMILDNENKCEYCTPLSFNKYYTHKQNELVKYLSLNGFIGTTVDKTINNGECGKERPDIVFDLNDKIIIVECDEHQHKQYSIECEQTRMKNIGQMFGGTPVYFIRWNPDNYRTLDNKIMKPNKKRLNTLLDLLINIKMNRIKLPIALVSVFYMYYDNWISIYNEVWNILTGYN